MEVPSFDVVIISAIPALIRTSNADTSVSYVSEMDREYTCWTCHVDQRRGPATRILRDFAAPRIVREALSALTLMKAGGSGDVGSSDGSGMFAFFHSSWSVVRDEDIRFESWVSSEGDMEDILECGGERGGREGGCGHLWGSGSTSAITALELPNIQKSHHT
jgi:hypothetical protein